MHNIVLKEKHNGLFVAGLLKNLADKRVTFSITEVPAFSA